jgi:hypothetical protein
MVSESRGRDLLAAAANPWLWSGLAAFFLGMALGQMAFAALGRIRKGRRSPKAATIRAPIFASIGLAAGAALLILPPSGALLAPGLSVWSPAVFVLGCLAGFLPRAVGIPVLVIAVGAVLLARSGLSDWSSYGGRASLARLLPFEIAREASGAVHVRSQLDLDLGPGAGSPGQTVIDLPFDSAALCVEGLELRGPLAALAVISRADRPPADAGSIARFFRVAGISGPAPAALAFPMGGGALSRALAGLARLAPGSGFEAGERAESSAFGGLVVHSRATSPLQALEPLRSLSFSLDPSLVPGIVPNAKH